MTMQRSRSGKDSKRRALNEKSNNKKMMNVNNSKGHFDSGDTADKSKVQDGTCKIGICGADAACKQITPKTYTCVCPHDSSSPTEDGLCPTRQVEKSPKIQEGACEVGICSSEAACKQITATTYTCLCPHDSSPPTEDGLCPTRHIVPLDPRKIENILPPQINTTKIKATTNSTLINSVNLSSSINTKSNSSLPEIVDKNNTVLILGGVTGSIFILIFIIIIIWRTTRCCSSFNKYSSAPSPIVLKRNLLLADRYAPNPQYSVCTSTSVPVIRRETLHFLHEIGEGCFGKVYKGELQNFNDDHLEIVAVKVLKESATREAEEDFLREVDIMSAFKHSNILSLLGVVLREGNVTMPMMVFEYMPHGDLAEVLRSQKKKYSHDDQSTLALNSKDLLSIALQIANGMKYLASQRFVHRDLACRNCLVADGPTVKIADFGMSRDVYTCDYYKIGGSRLLPVRWMSPESVMYGRFTLESDIWSYGIVLWEIYSYGKQPYYGHTNEEVVKLILQDIMLIPPDDCPTLICELMQSCWKTDPRDRIRFNDIYNKLDKAYNCFVDTKMFKSENESRTNTMRTLPRPPPLNILPKIDLLDHEGYLLPKEIKEPVQYLETLPG